MKFPTVEIFPGEDGKPVVVIDTTNCREANNGQPVLRVRVNDARIWEGFADGSEEYGDDV